jgi:hypothetical protein
MKLNFEKLAFERVQLINVKTNQLRSHWKLENMIIQLENIEWEGVSSNYQLVDFQKLAFERAHLINMKTN